MAIVNFELLSNRTNYQAATRNFPASATLEAALNPNNSNPLLDGEWLQFDAAGNLERGSGVTEGPGATVPNFCVFGERGRLDVQALKQPAVLFDGGMWEARTRIYDPAGLAINDKLMVADVTYESLTRRGLKEATAGKVVIGYVTKLPAGGWLQFLRVPAFILA